MHRTWLVGAVRLLCVLLVVVGGPFRMAAAAGRTGDFQAIGPIHTLALQISGFHKDWVRRGFEEPQLYAEVETWLQTAGYKVITPAALKDYPDAALLSLELHVNRTIVNYSYLVFLKLKIKVPVEVNRVGFVTRTVWSAWRIGGVDLDFPGRLHEPIFSLLHEFQYRR